MQKFKAQEYSPLLAYLFKHCAPMTKTKVKQTLKYGAVRVNGRVTTSHAYPLKPGDLIELTGKKAAVTEQLKTGMDFKLLFEDEDLIVVEKPSGLLTMGTDREKEKTLYYQLTAYQKSKSKLGKGRIFIVHRLDREASGLLGFAKNEAAKRALQGNWSSAIKKYFVVAEGTPRDKEGMVRSHLMEDDFRRVYSARAPSKEAKLSVTHYRVVKTMGTYSLLEVALETGRKNQIRVHLADIGCPIAGDDKYGAQTDPLGRLALHAHHLAFDHPVSGKRLAFDSPCPESFSKVVKA